MMRPINCRTFEYWSEELSSPRLDSAYRAALEAHRSQCAGCADFAFRSHHQRRAIRSLGGRPMPIHLAVHLRVLASKDRVARLTRKDWASRIACWRQQLWLWANNLWKPVAIPTAGGLASALVIFSTLMPTFAFNASATADVPTAFYQSAEVNTLSPFGVDADQITVDVRIDSSGRVVDYSVPRGEADIWMKDMQLRRAVENNLLFMSFRPAVFFGQPASDTIRITIRRSQIEVKG